MGKDCDCELLEAALHRAEKAKDEVVQARSIAHKAEAEVEWLREQREDDLKYLEELRRKVVSLVDLELVKPEGLLSSYDVWAVLNVMVKRMGGTLHNPEAAFTRFGSILAAQRGENVEIIEDGFGSIWPAKCPHCGAPYEIIRPGQARCSRECSSQEAFKDEIDAAGRGVGASEIAASVMRDAGVAPNDLLFGHGHRMDAAKRAGGE